MERYYAFTDESGDSGFDFEKPNVSTCFIITSVIVSEDKLIQVRTEIEDIL